ncbi:MAG: hypothetical protein KDA17_08010, partial [Candidatus Saccharibacteria bacterium]|nr:hypothetical protein [Candidatus Saccharibacteria bacterium]
QQCRLRPLSPGLMAYQKGGIMSARTISNTGELVAAVPVDMIQIVDGPRFRRMHCAMFRLEYEEHVKQLFTLMTPASDSRFQRELLLASVYNDEHGSFQFTAIFCDKIVSGKYNPRTRNGWFSLD